MNVFCMGVLIHSALNLGKRRGSISSAAPQNMELSSGGVPGKPGVELHLIFSQWIWTGFAGSSTLQVEQNLGGSITVYILPSTLGFSYTHMCKVMF